MSYLIMMFLVFVVILIHAIYTETYLDGAYCDVTQFRDALLLSIMAVILAVVWPVSLTIGLTMLVVRLLHNIIKKKE